MRATRQWALRWAGTTILLVQAVNPEFNASPVVDIYILVAAGAQTQSAAMMTLAERLRDEMPRREANDKTTAAAALKKRSLPAPIKLKTPVLHWFLAI